MLWSRFDESDTAARRAHAARIAAIAPLLGEIHPGAAAATIASRSQVSYRTARGWVDEATDLHGRTDLASACARGELSSDQAAALRVLSDAGADGAWVECLASEAGRHDFRINDLERMARKKKARELERTDEGRYFKMAVTRDERFVRGRFQLHPEEAAALEHQLDARVPDGTKLRDLPAAHADALMRMVEDAVRGPGSGPRPGTRPVVFVRSDPDVVDGVRNEPGEVANDTFVPAAVVREIARRAGGLKDIDLRGVNLDTKDVPEAVRRWVVHRDQGRCRGIDCVTPTLKLQLHHIQPRSRGGTHHPSNVVLLCVVCHQIRIHRDGWAIAGSAEDRIIWIRPDGTLYRPPPVLRRARWPDAR